MADLAMPSRTLAPSSDRRLIAVGTRVYFTGNGPTDTGTVVATERYDATGAPTADSELYARVAFDDGMTDWFHHSLLTDSAEPGMDEALRRVRTTPAGGAR